MVRYAQTKILKCRALGGIPEAAFHGHRRSNEAQEKSDFRIHGRCARGRDGSGFGSTRICSVGRNREPFERGCDSKFYKGYVDRGLERANVVDHSHHYVAAVV